MSLFSLLVWIALGVRHGSAVDSLVDLNYTKLQGSNEVGAVTQWLGVPFAAAPVGELRFRAPIDPPSTIDVVDATKMRPICLPRSASDFTMKPSRRFTVSEDCLYLNIFAPSNATTDSKLPVMYFVQGGGFSSNSNANFNGSDLASFGNMIVVQVNYRVGPFGFLQSREVQGNGSLNNGLKDVIQGLKWLKQHVASFGGDPNQMVAVGDSAGATSIALLLTAWSDNNPNLIKGAIMESASVATIRTLDQGEEQYACLLNATKCTEDADTLACLRGRDASELQTEECQFNPHLDDDLIKMPMLTAFEQGEYLKIPNIMGNCAQEGTKNVPKSTDTVEQALKTVQNQAQGALSNRSLQLIAQTYLSDPNPPVFPDSGRLWRPLADVFGDFRERCIVARVQNAMARDGVATYNYNYAVVDAEQEQLGFGAYHTVELNGVFGANNTDGAPPKSYYDTGDNAPIVPITMAYWASFVRSLDPNTGRLDGTPEWKPWTGPGEGARERLRFMTGNMGMEQMNSTTKSSCDLLDPMLPAIESPMQKGQPLVELRGASTSPRSPSVGVKDVVPSFGVGALVAAIAVAVATV